MKSQRYGGLFLSSLWNEQKMTAVILLFSIFMLTLKKNNISIFFPHILTLEIHISRTACQIWWHIYIYIILCRFSSSSNKSNMYLGCISPLKVDREDHFQRAGFLHIIICVFLGYKVINVVKNIGCYQCF